MTHHPVLKVALRVAAVIAIVFGVMTIVAGASVVLGLESARADHPHYVPFVLWFNTLSSLAYVAAGIGLWLRRRWAVWIAAGLVAGLVVTGVGFGLHVATGGAYDRSTIGALALRLAVWSGLAALAWFSLVRLPARRSPSRA